MASSSAATRSAGQIGGRRRGLRWLVVLAAAAALAWAALAPPPAPTGGSRLSAFSPATLASLEQEAWEAYYYRQWPRLFWLMLQVMRTQFGLSWAQSVYGAYLNTRAQLVFARQGDLGGEAQEYMRQFYALVREPPSIRKSTACRPTSCRRRRSAGCARSTLRTSGSTRRCRPTARC
jgi:hypothetical protein